MTPSERDLEGPRRADIERYFQGAQAPAPERIQLFRLAWDIVGSAFGSRQLLYERYFSGDPIRFTAGRYLPYTKAPLLERVGDFLQQADSSSHWMPCDCLETVAPLSGMRCLRPPRGASSKGTVTCDGVATGEAHESLPSRSSLAG